METSQDLSKRFTLRRTELMISQLSIRVCEVITSCTSTQQLRVAERYMILAGKDFTNLVRAKEQQIHERLHENALINWRMNDLLNEKAALK